jgi:hypothetical protein
LNRFRYWSGALPLPLLFLLAGAVWVAVQQAEQAFFETLITDRADLITTVLGGVVFSGIITVSTAFRRRRVGGPATQRAIVAATRTGVLPAGADAAIWSPELARRRMQLRNGRVVSIVLFGLLVVLIVAISIAPPKQIASGMALVAVFGLLTALGWWDARRRLPKIERLLAGLNGVGRTPDTGSTN